MADYNVGNIEIAVVTNSNEAIKGLDKTIAKLKEFNKIDKNLQNIFLRINQLGNGLTRISKIDLGVLNSKISGVATSTQAFVTSLANIKEPTFADTASSLNRLGNAFRQFDNLKNFDFRAMYQSFNSLNRILDPFLQKLKDSEASLKAMSNILNNLKARTITKAGQEIDRVTNKTNRLNRSATDTSSALNKMFNLGQIYFLYNYTKRAIMGVGKAISYASDYIEILNKFQVSFQDLYKENLKSVNELANAFGFSTNTLLDYTATFNNMLKGLKGLSDETSATISQTLTKMAIDYSSLFNVSIDRAMNAFQSALAGNIRSIRAISGFDVSETTIFSIYQQLGGEKSMRQLNQLEKRLLRIIAIEQQMEATGALGDYARTIETTSNQIKILKEQLIEVGKWIGMNLLVYIKPVIQYTNAILMTIKEMAKATADLNEQLGGIDYEEEFANFGKEVNDANQEVESLVNNLSLLSFDKLNILGSSKTSSSVGGLSVEGRILDSLKEYNMVLSKVKTKAGEISEKMLTWLGYKKQPSGEDGEFKWILGEGYTNLEKIKDAITFVATTLISTKLIKSIKTISSSFKGLLTSSDGLVPKLGLIGATIALIAKGFKDMYQNNKAFKDSIDKSIQTIKDNIKTIFGNVNSSFKKIEPIVKKAMNYIKIFFESVLNYQIQSFIDSLALVSELIKSLITKDFSNLGNVWKEMVGNAQDMFARVGEAIGGILGFDFNGWLQEKIIDPMMSTVFSGDWWKQQWNTICNFFAGIPNWFNEHVWKPIGNFFIGLINLCIRGFEDFLNLFVKGINGITAPLSKVWEWTGIPPIPKITEVKFSRVPAFAKGGVIEKPTYGLMGEYSGAKTNPEIVTPENLMRKVFAESLMPMVQAIISGDKEVINAIGGLADRPINLNGRRVSENIYNDLQSVALRKGKTLFGNN